MEARNSSDSADKRSNSVVLLKQLLQVVLVEGNYRPLVNFLNSREIVRPEDVVGLSDDRLGELLQALLADPDVNSALHSSLYQAIASLYFKAFKPEGSFGVVGDVRTCVADSFGRFRYGYIPAGQMATVEEIDSA